jgi:hypothetical protein
MRKTRNSHEDAAFSERGCASRSRGLHRRLACLEVMPRIQPTMDVEMNIPCPYCGHDLVTVPMNPSYELAGFIADCFNPRCVRRRVFSTPTAALEAAADRPAPPVRDLTEAELDALRDSIMSGPEIPKSWSDHYEDWIIRLTVKRTLDILRGKP